MKKIKKNLLTNITVLLGFLLLSCTQQTLKNQENARTIDFTDSSGQTKIYKETFFDDFYGTTIDTSKWTVRDEQFEWPEEGDKRLVNWFKNEAVKVEDGNLIITDYKDTDKLVSGAITTRGKFEQSHGLFEIRFKCDYSSGLWYAFWLMDDNNNKEHIDGSPVDAAEIDIFEVMPNTWVEPYKNYFKTAINYDSYNYDYPNEVYPNRNDHPSFFSIQAPDLDDSFYGNWHTVYFLWGDDNYELYLDGKLQYIMKGDDCGGMCQGTNHIIISSELREVSWAKDLVEELLPARFYVDYVKVYSQY